MIIKYIIILLYKIASFKSQISIKLELKEKNNKIFSAENIINTSSYDEEYKEMK